jgi:hypothetical protein
MTGSSPARARVLTTTYRPLRSWVRIMGLPILRPASSNLMRPKKVSRCVRRSASRTLARSRLWAGAVALDHRHAVFFDDRQHRLGQAGAIWSKHEIDAVLLDEALGKVGATRRRRLIVVVADGELMRRALDLDAALLVDLGDGEIVAVFGIGAVQRIFPALRDRRPERDHLIGARQLRYHTENQANAQYRQQKPFTPHPGPTTFQRSSESAGFATAYAQRATWSTHRHWSKPVTRGRGVEAG